MSTIIQIPGGTATIRDELVSERHFRILEAAFSTARPAMAKVQEAVDEALREEGLDPATVSQEQRKERLGEARITEIVSRVAFTRQENEGMLDLQDAAIVAFLERWSLKEPVPTIDTVQDLPRDLYQALGEATKERAYAAVLGTDFDVQPPGENPTGGSGSSSTPSEASPESQSTPELPSSGESTAIAS